MNRTIAIHLIFTITSLKGYSQSTDSVSANNLTLSALYNRAEIVIDNPTSKPIFPGGHSAWTSFLRSRISPFTPLTKGAKPGRYVVVVRFKCDKEGNIKEVVAETSCHYGMEDEVVKSIKESPAWSPAIKKDGEKVSYVTRQVVIFILKSSEGKIEIP